MHLRRKGLELSYYRHDDGTEVDFVYEQDGRLHLVQVSADITSADTRKRELKALSAAMRELAVDEATIVTLRQEETLETAEGKVHIVPAWWWTTGYL